MGKKRGRPVVVKRESYSDSDSSFLEESSADDSEKDEHWEPKNKAAKKKTRRIEIKPPPIKLKKEDLQKITPTRKVEKTKLENPAKFMKVEKKNLKTDALKGKVVKKESKSSFTYPEQLPLKKPSEREWEAVGNDLYGNLVPDPKSKWGVNFIVPHGLEKYPCDICQLSCASRTGLVNHRQVHFRSIKHFDPDKKPPEATPGFLPSTVVTTAEVKPIVTHSPVRPTPRKVFNAQGTQTEISGTFYQDSEESSSGKKSNESTSETIFRLVERGELKQCVCGLLFTDTTMFFLHKQVHSEKNPKKCALCHKTFPNYYNFTIHFYEQHTEGDDE